MPPRRRLARARALAGSRATVAAPTTAVTIPATDPVVTGAAAVESPTRSNPCSRASATRLSTLQWGAARRSTSSRQPSRSADQSARSSVPSTPRCSSLFRASRR
jgi:hypothetical protein